jgi:hypothetical protein
MTLSPCTSKIARRRRRRWRRGKRRRTIEFFPVIGHCNGWYPN